MVEIPLLNDEYREAFLYLLDEMNIIKLCSDDKRPWYPKDEEKLTQSLEVYKRWYLDPGKNPILNFPWPNPGEIPKVRGNYLKPTEEEKKKIRAFIEKNEGPEMDSLTEMIVQLAKDLIREVH